MTRNKWLLVASMMLLSAVFVTIFSSSTYTKEKTKSVKTETTQSPKSTPTKTYAKVSGIWTYDCEIPEQRPKTIILTCGDGGMIVMGIKWKTWTKEGAVGTGIYSENLCDPSCAEGKRVEVPVNIKLSDLFEYKGRNVLRNLDLKAVSGRELPDGGTAFTWDVAEFAVTMSWE